MYQRDYIVRMLQDAAKAIHEVLTKHQQEALRQRLALLNEAMKRLAGLDSKLVRGLSTNDLLALLAQGGVVDVGKSLVISDMQQVRAALLVEAGLQEEAAAEGVKSLELLLAVRLLEEGKEWLSEIDLRVEGAITLLGRAPRSAEVWEQLVSYYRENERYDKCEDALYHALDGWLEGGEQERGQQLLELGSAMYTGWLELSEEQLLRGGLSRDEVLAGMKELSEMKAAAVK
ncbi:DUF6483 family protein [Paenibacillus sp. YYML68]|uniref:DUF6483 family protein n=1 Tax=Paenibacillus sp. YYML68 TaxID=2909250 RepID=UPI0024911F07|nr:DUF6483 family protein [Paenibacillus sp. YYML68]